MKLKIQRDKKTIAQATITTFRNGDSYIEYIRVVPEYMGQRLATELLNRAKKQCDTLVALVDPDGTGLSPEQIIDWLKRHGFKFHWYYFPNYTIRKPCYVWENPENSN